jgi:hypothetical protein
MQANPGATPTELAKLAKCSRSTIVNVRKEQVKQARKEARKAVRAAPDKR